MEDGDQQLEDVNVQPLISLIDCSNTAEFERAAEAYALLQAVPLWEAPIQTVPVGDLLQLQPGAPYQGESGISVIDQAAIGSSSSITDIPVHVNKYLDELLAPSNTTEFERAAEANASLQAVPLWEASSQTVPVGDLLQLQLGAPYQGESGISVIDQAAIGSSSSITDIPVHVNKYLDELLAPSNTTEFERAAEANASLQAVPLWEASSQTVPVGDLLQLQLGAPYQGESGISVIDQAAIGSSSSITDIPVDVNKYLDESLGPLLKSVYENELPKRSANLKRAEEEKKERADVEGHAKSGLAKENEVTIVVLGLANLGRRHFGNFTKEDIIQELSYADQVILVVDPMKEFKKDYPNNNFRGYGFLTYHLGFKDIVICVNKVDLLTFPKEKYGELKNDIHNYLTYVGFEWKRVQCVPISLLSGQNVLKRPKDIKWHKEGTLMEMILRLRLPLKSDSPLRFVFHQWADMTEKVSKGRVHYGKLATKGGEVVFTPGGWITEVQEITLENTEKVEEAYPMELVNIKMGSLFDGRPNPGSVVSSLSQNTAKECEVIMAQLFVIDADFKLGSGLFEQYRMWSHYSFTDVMVDRVCEVVDRRSGNIMQAKEDEILSLGQCGVVKMVPALKAYVTMETLAEYPSLGRVYLIGPEGNVTAVGFVLKIADSLSGSGSAVLSDGEIREFEEQVKLFDAKKSESKQNKDGASGSGKVDGLP